MDSLVGKLKNFVPIDKRFGYVDDVDMAYHEPSFTWIWNNKKRQDFVRSIPKILENITIEVLEKIKLKSTTTPR